nr:hypothetical protein KitaXyl93_71680 [Kitasatospora sp. Xyl93]
MADKDSGPDGPGGIGDRPQDDFVARNLPGPSERPARTLTLSGLLGDSDRAGFRRLYFNTQLDYYAEFASADVLSADTVAGDRPPFVGHDATTVTLRRDATVHFTRVQTAAPVDEFDLDLRLERPRRAGAGAPGPVTLPGPTFDGCRTRRLCVTDVDCPTDFGAGCTADTFRCTAQEGCATFDATCRCTVGVCGTVPTFHCTAGPLCDPLDTLRCTAGPGCATFDATCRRMAGPVPATADTLRRTAGPGCGASPGVPGGTRRFATGDPCRTEFAATCQTCPGDTCRTCEDATCDTCRGATCRTCDTCNPHVFTCGPNPRCGP